MSDPPARGRYDAVLEMYERLEPPGTDTWNPLEREREVEHRVALYGQLARALRDSPVPIAELAVLDIGCGNGRSTRVYLDFGLLPRQLCGVDLRADAIAQAKRSHAGIRFLAYSGERLPVDDGAVSWVAVCTVLSSVPGRDARAHLVSEIRRALGPRGAAFYWDLDRAHGFAGGNPLDARELFTGWRVLYEGRYGASPDTPEGTHRAALLAPPRG